jgi:hypothetical protein
MTKDGFVPALDSALAARVGQTLTENVARFRQQLLPQTADALYARTDLLGRADNWWRVRDARQHQLHACGTMESGRSG